jgi:hypothetical protein
MTEPTIIARPVHLERPAPREEPAPVLHLAIDRGPLGEVRIQSKTIAGRRLVDVRLFKRRAGGGLRATDKGIALRLGELADVVRVLAAALVASAGVADAGRGHS